MQSQTTFGRCAGKILFCNSRVSGRAGTPMGVPQVNIEKEKMNAGMNKKLLFFTTAVFFIKDSLIVFLSIPIR